ncbi:MAG: aminomethyl-transferring glycine dehydrogenase subunit GcvPB [Bacteroidales bacterium]|nr:aminomethyl-transferring glycine dehydrogenase subunit GcvPB [Bacteroidales bacterium]
MRYYDKLIFELSVPGRSGYSLPKNRFGAAPSLPDGLKRGTGLTLPEVSEVDVVRHYTNLSQMNFGVDTGFYPLGSCTMKYNPKLNEEIASHPSFAHLHPLQPAESVQGALEVYWNMERTLSEITGMSAFTFNPCAGAHGELTGLMIMRRYHELRGDSARVKVIVPDSAHGTNPASAAVCGLEVVQVRSLENGRIDVEALKPLLDETVAGIMMTNPNTLGLFETEIREIASLVHGVGGLLYYDGANMNPLVGVVRPGDMGFDIMHLNLHKTFSTPHGGGGPGSGPVGVAKHLERCLPSPRVVRGKDGRFAVESSSEDAAGQVSGFMGNFGVILRAYAYLLMLGKENLPLVGKYSTLSANYVKEMLKDVYKLPIEGICKHEFVFDGFVNDGSRDGVEGATTLDLAKRLLDFGFHAPTIYFPLLFHQAIMIEPTETESKETLDAFIAVMRKIAAEAAEDPSILHEAPHSTPVRRPDETTAARNPVLKWKNL